jgi:polyferredoxin
MLARQIAVGFGIALIFPMLIYYGVAAFYPRPDFQTMVTIVTRIVPSNATAEQRQEAEDLRRKREEQQKAYNAAAKDFARVMVLITTPLGVAAILIGAYISLHAIGTGLIFGGIFSVAWGYYGYWNYLDDWLRFVSLLAGFGILLFVGYRMISGPRPKTNPP